MKKIALGIVLATMPAGLAPLFAQVTAPAALRSGEIPLTITARGEVEADYVLLQVALSEGGTDRAKTEASHHASEQAIIAALGKIGIAVDKISIGERKVEEIDQMVAPRNRFGFAEAMSAPMISVTLDEEQFAADAAAAAGEVAAAAAVEAAVAAADEASGRKRKPPKPPVQVKTWAASSVMTVTIDRIDALPEAMRITRPRTYGEKPIRFVFKDEAAARRVAIERAMANARTEAEAYAAAMNYKLVKISGVSNTEPPVSVTDGLTAISRFGGRGKELGMQALRFATVNIDYVIAPK